MKKVIKVFGAVLLAVVIVIVIGFIQKKKVESEPQIENRLENVADIAIVAVESMWFTGNKLVDDWFNAKERLTDHKIEINELEQQKSAIEAELAKKRERYHLDLDWAKLIKSKLKEYRNENLYNPIDEFLWLN